MRGPILLLAATIIAAEITEAAAGPVLRAPVVRPASRAAPPPRPAARPPVAGWVLWLYAPPRARSECEKDCQEKREAK